MVKPKVRTILIFSNLSVYGDFTELCLRTLTDDYDWFETIVCMDNNYDNIPSNVQQCMPSVNPFISRFNYQSVSYSELEQCTNSTASAKMLKASILRTNALGITLSPTVYAAGGCIYGVGNCSNLDPTTNQVAQFICQEYTGTKPAACTQFDVKINN